VTDEPAKDTEPPSRFGRFLQKYATLLSSTVLGIAGLAATSIWQFRQAATAQQQAESQQRVAEAAATNSWKIERADILSKNIATLAGNGSDTVEQRYGVLLSLTRGNLIDPELAVSYALELGKDNPDDMLSVLAQVSPKDYGRLARAFTLSCDERYGTSPAIDACTDKLGGRSDAIAQLFSDDGDAELGSAAPIAIPNAPPPPPSPLALLKDEHQVQIGVQRLTALYEPLLTTLYEGRKWDAIDRFLAYSTGAHLVGSLALSAAHTGEFVTDDEAKQLKQFHDTQSKWLVGYLVGTTCDPECKSRTLDVMVTHYAESQGSFDAAVRQLLESPRAQSAMSVTFLHARLLWCQVDGTDLIPLRDNVLVPAATAIVGNPKSDAGVRDALLSLVALCTEPADGDAGQPAWQALLAAADKAGEKLSRTLRDRRATAEQQRQNPPAAFKKRDFCLAPHTTDPDAPPTVAPRHNAPK
jgi:hypothetical protein